MKKHHRKQLTLDTETLQRLDAGKLADAVGGQGPVSGGTCAGFTCVVSRQCTNVINCTG